MAGRRFRRRRDRNSARRLEGRILKTLATAMPASPTTITGFATTVTTKWIPRSLQTSGGAGVRIAHLDTGYDPNHKIASQTSSQRCLARNFVDPDNPNDATDRSEGTLFNNFSHGCGTLSILAGATVPGLKPFGCAPERRDRSGSRRQPRRPVQQQLDRAGLRLCAFSSKLRSDPRPCGEHEHGRPAVASLGGRHQRAL